MKQEERRLQTTRLLLETTAALIREKGCHAVRIQDIMERSGLSKGAIFHYVKNKDELFIRLLQERLEETNRRFMEEVGESGNFEGPMSQIAENLQAYERQGDVANQVMIYLLGKAADPAAADALRSYYERSVRLSKAWIETGQRHGVIPASVDAERTAELFILMTFGLRVRASIPGVSATLAAKDVAAFMAEILQPSPAARERRGTP